MKNFFFFLSILINLFLIIFLFYNFIDEHETIIFELNENFIGNIKNDLISSEEILYNNIDVINRYYKQKYILDSNKLIEYEDYIFKNNTYEETNSQFFSNFHKSKNGNISIIIASKSFNGKNMNEFIIQNNKIFQIKRKEVKFFIKDNFSYEFNKKKDSMLKINKEIEFLNKEIKIEK